MEPVLLLFFISISLIPTGTCLLWMKLSRWVSLLYTHIHADVSRNIMTRFNERTNSHFFIKKNTSHTLFSKGLRKGWCWLCVRGELETERDCHILTPSSSDHGSTSSSFCWAAQPWVLRAQALCLEQVLTPVSYLQLELQLELQLTQAVCGTWLYNCLTSTCFLWAYTSAPNSTMSTGQGDILISSTGCTCYLHRCISWLTARSRVNMQQVCFPRIFLIS